LLGSVDRRLRVVAVDEAVPGQEPVGIGKVALNSSYFPIELNSRSSTSPQVPAIGVAISGNESRPERTGYLPTP
jgi:hypothetical protein